MSSDPDVKCMKCGYDLRGRRGRIRTCPECGTANHLPDCWQVRRPLRRGWSVAAIAVTSVGLVIMLGFRFLLTQRGLRLMDLYPHPPSFTPTPGTEGMLNLGSALGYICLLLALVSLPYCLIVTGVAAWRRDRRTATVASLCAILTVVYGLLAMSLGFVIAGV